MFAACGNLVKVFSLRTGLHIKTLRSATAVASADVHRCDIVQMCISNQNAEKEKRLLTICAKGVLAEWDAKSHQLLSTHQLQISAEGKIKHCVVNKTHIVVFQGACN